MIYVNPKVGRTGLCNMLFVWARALVYVKDHNAMMLAPRWTNLMRLGPLLRFERNNRYYLHEFTNEGYISGLRKFIINHTRRHITPDSPVQDGDVVDFSGWSWDYFNGLIERRDHICQSLMAIVSPELVGLSGKAVNEPFVGVHVRRGDFVTNGQWISDEWYIKAISKAREIVGNLPVKIFSDGDVEKLSVITKAVQNSDVMPSAPAIQDLFTLSKCKVLVATSRSTFSMWAVYLGQMPSIWSDVDLPPKMYVGEDKIIILKGSER